MTRRLWHGIEILLERRRIVSAKVIDREALRRWADEYEVMLPPDERLIEWIEANAWYAVFADQSSICLP